MDSRYPTVKLREILIQSKDFQKLDPTKLHKLLGVRWYGMGPFIREEKIGARIRANQLNRVRAGDFIYNRLFAWKGSFGLIPANLHGAYVSNEFPTFEILKDKVLPKYLEYYFKQAPVWDKVEKLSTGTTGISRNRLKEDQFLNLELSLPPLIEQQRIVAEIDSQMNRISKMLVMRIDRDMQTLWKSILKKAFSGKLVPLESQGSSPFDAGNLVPARHVTAIRRSKQQISISDELDLFSLPEGWLWTKLETLTESMKNGIYKPAQFYSEDGVACLRMYNIENGLIVLNNIKRMILTSEEKKEFMLKPGDLLVNRVNSRELVGKAAVIPAGLEDCVYESKNIRLRLREDCVDSKYANLWLNSYGRQYFSRHFQQTCGMASINQRQLRAMPIPLPPLNEQHHIVTKTEELGAKISEITLLQTQIDNDLKILVESTLNKVTKQSLLRDGTDYRQTQLAI